MNDTLMTDEEALFLRRALDLARQGQGSTSPNPMVGAVLVKDGGIVGEGFHRYAERKHAEVLAIEQAGPQARGATLYLNLEPCSHSGRTPPCCDLLIQSGIARVVACMPDPNPLVSGAGFSMLQKAGVRVAVGRFQEEAQKLNEAFSKFITTRRPFITLKAGITLDGKIADAQGCSQWITSPESRERGQRLRFESDAVLTGIGTVLKDDPLLTDRTGQTRRRPLTRIVLDSRLRLPLESRLARSLDCGDILAFCSSGRDAKREEQLRRLGVEVVVAPGQEERVPLDFVLQELGRREIISLLIEAGAEMNFALLRSGLVDKMVFFVAPRILGGWAPIPVFGGEGLGGLGKSRLLAVSGVERVGPDVMIEAYVCGKEA